jgi:hypothetical protein
MADDLVSALRAALGEAHQAGEKIREVEALARKAAGTLMSISVHVGLVKHQLGESTLVDVITNQVASAQRSASALAGDLHGAGERIEALSARVATTIVHLELEE